MCSSVHAPLSRCDWFLDTTFGVPYMISIHAPLSRCDFAAAANIWRDALFQSTHLFRGATSGFLQYSSSSFYFNPRTSFEVRRNGIWEWDGKLYISIHAPLSRCDQILFHSGYLHNYFNPRTSFEVRLFLTRLLSSTTKNFNPRTSFEVRPHDYTGRGNPWTFQSTHLFRGATGLPRYR